MREEYLPDLLTKRETSETGESVQRLLRVEILFAGFFSLFPHLLSWLPRRVVDFLTDLVNAVFFSISSLLAP